WSSAANEAGDSAAWPPSDDTQQTAALTLVTKILDEHHALIAVPIIWHHGSVPVDDDPAWDELATYIPTWLNTYSTDPAVIQAGNPNPTCVPAAYGAGLCIDGSDTAIAPILATIRHMESRGDYTAEASGATASGAYQFVDATWANYGGYHHAADAPPAVQDAKAAEHVHWILDTYGNDVGNVPLVWYLPAVLNNPALLDVVPDGNSLTPREYQSRWLARYQIETSTAGTAAQPTSCGSTVTSDGEFALPMPAAAVTPDRLIRSHHDYPAIDIGLPVGTQLYAPVSGTVTSVTTTTTTWYEGNGTSCNPATSPCQLCGVGVRITNAAGYTWSICHMSRNDLHYGDTVTAGQPIGLSGNTGHSSGPHLHYGIRTANGTELCPQALLTALYNHTTPPALAALPQQGCTH
ncbi:MAG: M23 family metallopeptidase, partial [Ilumatobacteraceae bacterium]